MSTRTVTAQGSGTGQGAPDRAAVMLTVQVDGDTPALALRRCGEVQAALLSALGVSASAGRVSVQPNWDHERQRAGKPQATSTVSALLPDLGAAGDVVTAALEAGGKEAQLQSMVAVVSDDSDALREARQAAFDAARAAGEQYATLAGGHLGQVLSVEPSGRGGAVMGFATSASRVGKGFDLADGAQDVTVSVTVTWELLD